MNRIIENLHIKFDCLINTRDNQSFFLRLADYVEYITREEETYQIIKKTEKAIEEEKEEGDSIYENKKERLWRSYQEILLIYLIINEKEKRKKLKELQKETLLKERWKFQDMIEEWEKIKMPMNKKTCAISQNPEILKIKKYKDYLIEVHNYLYYELHNEKEENKTKDDWYDYEKCSIYFYGTHYNPRGEKQKKLIKELLLSHQIENNNKKILKEGEWKTEKALEQMFNISNIRLKNIKKQINRNFKDKKFPLKIYSKLKKYLLICIK